MDLLDSPSPVAPATFYAEIREELARMCADEPWRRGVLTICELYAGTNAERFEAIPLSAASGASGSALAGLRDAAPKTERRTSPPTLYISERRAGAGHTARPGRSRPSGQVS